jgi:hypothetical protein
MLAHRGHELGPGAEHDAGLGPAEQLVAREADQVRALAQSGRRVGLGRKPPRRQIHQAAAAQVLHHRQVVSGPDPGELAQRHLGDETGDGEVAAVHLEQQPGRGADRALVVGGVGAIGGPHLHQRDARSGEDLRHPERPADLHQLAPRHDHFPTGGQTGEHQQHRGRVVVDGKSVGRSGQQPQLVHHRLGALTSLAALEVELQVAVALGGVGHRGGGLGRQRRPPQVRVQHDTGGVHDPGRVGSCQLGRDGGSPPGDGGDGPAVPRLGLPLEARPGLGEGSSRPLGCGPERQLRPQLPDLAQQTVDGRKPPASIGLDLPTRIHDGPW